MTTQPSTLDAWCAELSQALGLTQEVALRPDVQLLLDLSRDAAHSVARPAAPLTTYLVGLCAGLAGGTPEAVQAASAIARDLALGTRLGTATDGA